MSQPVTVLYRCPRLKHAGHRSFGVRAVTPRSNRYGQLRRVSFTNPFTRIHPAAVRDPRKTALSQCSRIEGSDDKVVTRWPRTLKIGDSYVGRGWYNSLVGSRMPEPRKTGYRRATPRRTHRWSPLLAFAVTVSNDVIHGAP